MRQIFQELECVHKRGIIHKNLKPDNILVSATGTVKISDFTYQKWKYAYTPEDPKERERSSREARRPWYRAPELLLRKELYGSEIDMWTAGCLLAELVLGVPLFNGENEIEDLFKIFKMVGVPNSVYAKSFPAWDRVNFCDATKGKDSRAYKALVSSLVPAREQVLTVLTRLAVRSGKKAWTCSKDVWTPLLAHGSRRQRLSPILLLPQQQLRRSTCSRCSHWKA